MFERQQFDAAPVHLLECNRSREKKSVGRQVIPSMIKMKEKKEYKQNILMTSMSNNRCSPTFSPKQMPEVT